MRRQRCNMRNKSKLALWLLFSALVIGAAVSPASAGFHHPRGLIMSTYPQQVLVFYAEGDQTVQLIVIMVPPWYFVEDLTTFETVTLTVTLKPVMLQRNTEPMRLLGGIKSDAGSTVTFQWSNVALGQDGDGAIEGAYLLCTITFPVDSKTTATGYYMLYLSAQATAGDVLFTGWDQIAVTFRPGHIPLQLGSDLT